MDDPPSPQPVERLAGAAYRRIPRCMRSGPARPPCCRSARSLPLSTISAMTRGLIISPRTPGRAARGGDGASTGNQPPASDSQALARCLGMFGAPAQQGRAASKAPPPSLPGSARTSKQKPLQHRAPSALEQIGLAHQPAERSHACREPGAAIRPGCFFFGFYFFFFFFFFLFFFLHFFIIYFFFMAAPPAGRCPITASRPRAGSPSAHPRCPDLQVIYQNIASRICSAAPAPSSLRRSLPARAVARGVA